MKKILALVVVLISVLGASKSFAQTIDQKRVSVGVDYAPYSESTKSFQYKGDAYLDKSGFDYTPAAFGLTLEVREDDGYKTEIRFRRNSLGVPNAWVQNQNRPKESIENQGSNVVTQFGGNSYTLDGVQNFPIKGLTKPGAMTITALGGINYSNVEVSQVTDELAAFGFHDESTTSTWYVGPKGGVSVSYSYKRLELTTQATIGILYQHGHYDDSQAVHSPLGMTSLPGTSRVSASTWARDTNWRSSAEVAVTKQISGVVGYEFHRMDTSDADYVFGNPYGVKTSTAFSTGQLTFGFRVRP
jgi:opacity protein-like surface antigen